MRTFLIRHLPIPLLFAALLTARLAEASCGAAFCALNTGWEALGHSAEPGMALDLRYDYISQNQLRSGSRTISADEVPGDVRETKTVNRNLMATFDYAAASGWGVSVLVPYLQRRHSHVDTASSVSEAWEFSGVGDAQVLGRFRRSADASTPWGFLAGLKLPSGNIDESNSDGVRAERSLQPGSGTTDAIAGVYHTTQMLVGDRPVNRFMQARIQAPVNVRAGYRPGDQFSLDAGFSWPAGLRLSAMLQLNALVKERDRGPEAEPEESGGSFLWLSPGLSYSPDPRLRLYGFVQLPLYQRVNGVQLAARWTASVGAGWRF